MFVKLQKFPIVMTTTEAPLEANIPVDLLHPRIIRPAGEILPLTIENDTLDRHRHLPTDRGTQKGITTTTTTDGLPRGTTTTTESPIRVRLRTRDPITSLWPLTTIIKTGPGPGRTGPTIGPWTTSSGRTRSPKATTRPRGVPGTIMGEDKKD